MRVFTDLLVKNVRSIRRHWHYVDKLFAVGCAICAVYWWLVFFVALPFSRLWLLLPLLASLVLWRKNTRLYLAEKRRLFLDELTLLVTLDASRLYRSGSPMRVLGRTLPGRLFCFAAFSLLWTLTELFLLPCFLLFPFRNLWLFSAQLSWHITRADVFEMAFFVIRGESPGAPDRLQHADFRALVMMLFNADAESFESEVKDFCGYDPTLRKAINTSSAKLSSIKSASLDGGSTVQQLDELRGTSSRPGITRRQFVEYMHLKTLHMPALALDRLLTFGLQVLENQLQQQHRQPVDGRQAMQISMISSIETEDDASYWQQHPKKPQQALEMRRAGRTWTLPECRMCYLRRVRMIASMIKPDWSLQKRAETAYAIRHRARLTTRAMMDDMDRVATLKIRDISKYGTPDGPTFEWLYEQQRRKGLDPDQIYQNILTSALRTNEAMNSFFQLFAD